MARFKPLLIASMAVLAGASLSSAALAQDLALDGPEAALQAAAPATDAPQLMDLEELAETAGGQNIDLRLATASNTMNATNEGNSVVADNYTSGDVSIGAGAMTGFNGIGNFVFNTGSNNNLMGSVNVSIVADPSL